MKTKQVKPLSPTYFQVRQLYHTAFPPEERPPYLLTALFALLPAISLTAYYDGQRFVGFSYTVATSQGIFVLFLAVAAAQRSRGFGSDILRKIAEQAGGAPLFLCMEPMDETAANYDQRLKRLAFYERNGYRRQGWDYHELGEIYEILATSDDLDYGQIETELNRLSLGLLRLKLVKKS